jgi:hypothetical protein
MISKCNFAKKNKFVLRSSTFSGKPQTQKVVKPQSSIAAKPQSYRAAE